MCPRWGFSKFVLYRPVRWLGFLILLSSSVSLAQTDGQHDPHFRPLSRQEKFDYYLSSPFSLQCMERSALAAIAQWRNSPPEWEQGMAGYRARVEFKLWPILDQENTSIQHRSSTERGSPVLPLDKDWFLAADRACGDSYSNGSERQQSPSVFGWESHWNAGRQLHFQGVASRTPANDGSCSAQCGAFPGYRSRLECIARVLARD